MTRQEIEFLRAAGFSIAEIMAMQPAQNNAPDPAGSPAPDQQPAQPAPAQTPEPKPAEPAQPAQPVQLAQPDNNPQMTELLTKILAAVQAGNRSAASQPTPEKLSPEEIAGKLY